MSKMDSNAGRTLLEAKRLYELGFAVHWLHVKSKRPLESGWTSGPRKPWAYLEKTYRKGLNVGVRLGTPSRIGGGHLCVVDVDVKSKEPHHKEAALMACAELLKGHKCPMVTSGRGNGSRHYYCLTAQPFKTFNPAASRELVKVLMPSKSPSKKELAELTPKELKAGIRIANAWEISLYSDGRQVVLPPSIHPDSGREYRWAKELRSTKDLSVIDFEISSRLETREAAEGGESFTRGGTPQEAIDDFKLSSVELSWLPISDAVKAAITEGVGVEDRSAYLLVACSALHAAGLSKNEILTVLTEPDTFLGACSYDHAQTKSRKRAALWLWNYTVKAVLEARDAKSAFAGIAIPHEGEGLLDEKEQAAQSAEIESERHWSQSIKKTKEGKPYSSVENVVTILEGRGGVGIFRRNLFAMRDTYAKDAPWGGKEGEALSNDDAALIRLWLGKAYGFEPSKETIYDAVTNIAVAHAFDPVKEYLEALPGWDGVQRLNTWLIDHFEATGDAGYLSQVFRKWMVAMIMRVYHPGSKFDWMPIFEGAQGVGKSSFGRLLVGDRYFLDWLPNLGDKDSALALQGMWGVEMGELATMRKNELEVVKAYVTRTVDKVRPPFGRLTVEVPRRCVFFGTTNREKYLMDESGNRRFKPVMVGRLDFEALERDRDQLFAEAKYLWDHFQETEETLYLRGAAKEYEATIHKEKMVEDDGNLMASFLRDFLGQELPENFDPNRFQIRELFEGDGPLKNWKLDSRNSLYAAKALRLLGGDNRKIRGNMYWKAKKRVTVSPTKKMAKSSYSGAENEE